MEIVIHWDDFVRVFLVALLGAVAVVAAYACGLRLMVLGGKAPVVTPAEFTDAITVISDKEARRAQRAAEKASRKNPLTDGQKTMALYGAYACFGLSGLGLLGGILLIVLG